MIGVVDLDMGNLRSVGNALHQLGEDVAWVRGPSDLGEVSHVILPGVGSFHVAARHLDAQGLRGALVDFAASGKPVLGICLGMQLLAARGDEGGGADGLGLVAGLVTRFDSRAVPRIPHVGWNEARLRRKHPVFERVKSGCDFYYVHSYHFVVDDPADAAATVEYGGAEYTSVVARGNVVGTQFHPEKSQASGLRLLENFCLWDGTC